MGEEESLAESCFKRGYEIFKKYFEISGIRFVLLPISNEKISISVNRGDQLLLLVCLHNTKDKDRRVGVKIEVPKRKGLSKTHLRSVPEDGKYWAVDVPAKGYEYIPFRIFTSNNTPKGEYEITVSVWPSKARTLGKVAAGLIGGIALGRIGSAIAKAAVDDEKVVQIKITVK